MAGFIRQRMAGVENAFKLGLIEPYRPGDNLPGCLPEFENILKARHFAPIARRVGISDIFGNMADARGLRLHTACRKF